MTGLAKLGRYTILKPLAAGGMAELLLGRTDGIAGFERHVVIKKIRDAQADDAKFVDMFLTEARLAATLHHNNIIQVYDIGADHGTTYMAMEYVHGEDLREFLRRHKEKNVQVPIQHVLTIAIGIASALHHAHEQRIVHRDVAPANIIVGYDGSVKLVDFGIARATESAKTQSGIVKGKSSYMSPEQVEGKTLDRRSDVWSLGIVLYELATVRRLFKGATDFETLKQIVNLTIEPPSKRRADLPMALERVLMRALTRDIARRFQTTDQMRIEFDELARRHGGASTSALMDHMRLMFGTRPEPWLVDDKPVTILIDFDEAEGTPLPAALPPAPVVEPSVPIEPLPSVPVEAPVFAGANPWASDPSKSTSDPGDVVSGAVDVLVENHHVGDSTSLVIPLPPPRPSTKEIIITPDEDRAVAERRAPRRKPVVALGIGGMLVVGVSLALIIGLKCGGDVDTATAGGRPRMDRPSTVATEPVAKPTIAPPVTAGSDNIPKPTNSATPDDTAKPDDTAVKPDDTTKPDDVTDKAATTGVAVTGVTIETPTDETKPDPATTKHRSKHRTRPTTRTSRDPKDSKDPKWDPNSLFLKKPK